MLERVQESSANNELLYSEMNVRCTRKPVNARDVISPNVIALLALALEQLSREPFLMQMPRSVGGGCCEAKLALKSANSLGIIKIERFIGRRTRRGYGSADT